MFSGKRAVAYYRCAGSGDGAEDPIAAQRREVRRFARKQKIVIIKFVDRCKSGLSTEARDGLNHLLGSYVVGHAEPFDYILIIDIARLARCIHLHEYCMQLCAANKKEIVFVAEHLRRPKRPTG